MALHSLLEVALHFESFRNVDLFHQGLYHLKARLYREHGDGERIVAIPYGHSTLPSHAEPSRQGKTARVDHHDLIPGSVTEDAQNTYSTRSFLIRYCEEEVELNDLAQFRFELSADLMQDSTPLTLEVELMFGDLSRHGGAEGFGSHPDADLVEFKSVATQVYRIYGADTGLHEYCPIVFDEYHFCLASLCIHTALIDVRFRMRPEAPVCSQPQLAKNDSKKTMDDSAMVMRTPDVPKTQNAALSLKDCMFGKCRGTGQAQLLLATEAFYQTNLHVLSKSYSGLVSWFEEVVSKCLTDGQREALSDDTAAPDRQLTDCGLLLLPPDGSLQHWLKGNVATVGADNRSAFKTYLASQLSVHADENDFARHVALDMNVASCTILGLWHKVLNVMLYSCREITVLLRAVWERRMTEQWQDVIVKQPILQNVLTAEAVDNNEPINAPLHVLEKSLRQNIRPVLVEDVGMTSDPQPVIYSQRYAPRKADSKEACTEASCNGPVPSAPKPHRGAHMVVLVHGFQGNSFDMRLFKNNLALIYPDTIYMVSTSNEDNTDGDLHEMGIRLAQEVVNHIADWCPGSALSRISFVGYSIGGIIIRAAIPHLQDYHSKLYTFLSLSSAHMGFMDQQSPLFNSTLYLLTKWKKCLLLEQLALRDAPELKDTYLAKLCKTRGLEHFQWVALVSSQQDNYSPCKSSRIEMDPAWEKSRSTEVYASMVRSLWEPIRPERVVRIRAHFDLPEKNIDAMIGRVAHIRFIECQPLMRMLIHNYSFLFR